MGNQVDYQVDTVVIGAGVVGLAIARQLVLGERGRGRGDGGSQVLVVEAKESYGTGTSSRNSEVVHAGLYYPPSSLKAELCVKGKHMLYEYCEENNVPYRKCGKLLVAPTEADIPKLDDIEHRAKQNGVVDLVKLSSSEVMDMEQGVTCAKALFSPTSGIVDSHSLMAALESDIENAGGMLAYNTKVVGGECMASTEGLRKIIYVEDAGSGQTSTIQTERIILSAGLHSEKIARSLKGIPQESIPRTRFVKGSYFTPGLSYGGPSFDHLVYPVPSDDGGLGVHATIDLQGALRFGPDVEWLDGVQDPDTLTYDVDETRASQFEAALSKYCRGITPGCLEPAYAGIRPKILTGQDGKYGDFMISTPRDHGIDGLLCLYGIESPGLTSCLVLGAMCGGLC